MKMNQLGKDGMNNLCGNRLSGKQSGFTLIENLIAIVLFTIGALGIAASTAAAIRINTDNQARAMALAVATKTFESVYITAETPGANDATFQGQLSGFVDSVTVYGDIAAGNNDDFVISVLAAVDAAGTNVLTTAGPYVSPVTVAALVTYQGNAGRTNADGTTVEIADIKQVRTSFTYVLPQAVAGP